MYFLEIPPALVGAGFGWYMTRQRNIPLDPLPWEDPHDGQMCHHKGCRAPGRFPSPNRKEKKFFCLEHARLHNEAWDYFSNMSREEIDYHRQQDLIGWRPSWPLGTRSVSLDHIRDRLGLLGATPDRDRPHQAHTHHGDRYPEDIHQALTVLGLSGRVTQKSLKAHYNKLVRRLHPDANGGDRRHEAQFRRVNEAYKQLGSFLKKQSESC